MKWLRKGKSTRHTDITTFLLSKRLSKSFSEQDIIELQDIFLTNGFHFIQVKDWQEGRTLIDLFLTSLNYYQHVACLSSDYTPIDEMVENIHYVVQKYENNLNGAELQEFFLEEFDYDFLWIELSDELLHSHWFNLFQSSITEYHFDEYMPIILMGNESLEN